MKKMGLVGFLKDGRAIIKAGGKYVFIETGKEVSKCAYDYIDDFSEGFAAVNLNDKFGFIDETGKEITPCKYDTVYEFSEGFAKVKLNGEWGLIDKTGREIVPCKYDWVGDFSEGRGKVELNGKWGFIDENGEEVIPCKYNGVADFSEDWAAVNLNGKWGFIDTTGKEVIPCKLEYDWVGHFSCGGRAIVEINGKYGLIDRTGFEVVPPICESKEEAHDLYVKTESIDDKDYIKALREFQLLDDAYMKKLKRFLDKNLEEKIEQTPNGLIRAIIIKKHNENMKKINKKVAKARKNQAKENSYKVNVSTTNNLEEIENAETNNGETIDN